MKTIPSSVYKWSYRFVYAFFILGFLHLTVSKGWSQTSSVLVKWDFNSNNVQCNGAVDHPYTRYNVPVYKEPLFLQNLYTYCPNFNNGCGAALLGGCHNNTDDFANAICLSNFYYPSGSKCPYNPLDPVWHPDGPANLYIDYKIPAGKSGCLTNFAVKILQSSKSKLKFKRQGIGVYRDGVLIYSTTADIVLADVNVTPITFTFPANDPNFCADGTKTVNFKITFGLVEMLPVSSIIGYDDISISGYCPTPPTVKITDNTCIDTGTNDDGTITVVGANATDKYQYSTGTTFNSATAIPATAAVIPAGGVIVNNLANPATPQPYTVRVTSSTGSLIGDYTVTLNPKYCPICVRPSGALITPVSATCNGETSNSNAQIQITGVADGTKVGLFKGSPYNGPDFAGATALVSGAYSFTGIDNPPANQEYTIRIFNDDDCYKDTTITLNRTSCGCDLLSAQYLTSNSLDTISINNFATAQICADTNKIDLELVKTVSPNAGVTCPVGTEFSWKLTLKNAGTKTAKDILVGDLLPSKLTITATPTVSLGSYTTGGGWVLDSLQPNQTATLTLYTKALQVGTITNCAEVIRAYPNNDEDSTPGNGVTTEDDYSCATITVTGPNLPEVTKSFSPNRTNVNTPVQLRINLINNETTPIQLTAPLVDVLPNTPAQLVIDATPNLVTTLPGVIANANGTTITVPSGTTLLPGNNFIQVQVIAPTTGDYCNVIAGGSLKTTSCDNALQTEACLEVNDQPIPPSIAKTMSPLVIQVGQTDTLTLLVKNQNTKAMTLSQEFTDDLPANLTAISILSGTTCPNVTLANGNTQIVMAANSTVPANSSCLIKIAVKSTIAETYCNHISMNALIVTVDTTTNLGNMESVEACITVVNNPCTAIDLTTITATPAGSIAPNGTVKLKVNGNGKTASTLYQWSNTPAGGSFSAQADSTVWTAPATPGTYTIKVIGDNKLTGYGTCKDSATVNLVVEPPCTKPNAGTDQSVCAGTAATLTGTSPTTGTWTVQGNNPAGAVLGTSSGGIATVTFTATATGTYHFIYTSAANCTDTMAITVNVKPVIADGSATICASETLDLTSKIADYNTLLSPLWRLQTATGTIIINPTDVRPLVNTNYVLIAQSAAGCKDTANVAVTVNPLPTIVVQNGFPACRSNGTAYSIKFTKSPAGAVVTAKNVATGVAIAVTGDSVANIPLTVASVRLIVTNGLCKDSVTVTAPVCDKPVGSIGDFIWKDSNDNGLQDLPTEKGVSGVKVNLYAASGGTKTGSILQTKTTAANGLYLFTGLLAGDYIVEIDKTSLKDTCAITSKQNTGGDDTKDSDFNPTSSLSQVITLNPVFNPTTPAEILATNNLTVDAGLVKVCIPPTRTVAATDPTCAVAGKIELTATNGDKYGVSKGATYTGPAYASATAVGTLPILIKGNISHAADSTWTIRVFNKDNNCFKDTTVTVKALVKDATISVNNGFPACRSNGTAYSIKFTKSPAGAVVTAKNVATGVAIAVTGDSVANIPLTVASVRLIVTNGFCKDSVDVTAPVCDKPTGSIGDFIWKDSNDNGLQDLPTEKGVSGVKVNLYAASGGTKTGSILQTKTTAANGLYLFTGLLAGDYIVEIDKTSLKDTCAITSKQNTGGDDTKDSDFNPTSGLSQVITLNPVFNPTTPAEILATNNLTVDAGLVAPCVKSKVTLTGAPVCSADVQTYSITFSVANKNGIIKVNKGTLTGTNPYTVTGIPSGATIKITDSLSAVCKFDTIITGPNCNCNPALPRLLTNSYTVCAGDTFPTLKATVVGLATVEWFTQATGGTAVFTGLNFKPSGNVPATGAVFYAQARSTDPTCPTAISANRVMATVNAQDCTKEVDLALKKSINTKIARIGDVLTYTLKVWNESNTNATGVEVSDSIATTVQFQTNSFTASRGSATITGNVIKWTIGSIAANGDTVTLTYRVKATQEGIHFNTAEISKVNEKDKDSTPSNGKENEDDIDYQCFTVPIKLCTGSKVEASVPAKYTNVQWFKDGSLTPIASGNVVLLSGVGTYTFTASNQACPTGGCCPIIIENSTNCCPVQLCVPLTIRKIKI